MYAALRYRLMAQIALFRRLENLGVLIQHQLGMTTMRVLDSIYYG